MAFGLDAAKKVIITFLILAVIGIAVMLCLQSLGNAGIFTAGSYGANATTFITNNVSSGVVTFFSYAPTIFIILAVVVLIALIALLILYVEGIGGGREGEHQGGL